MTSLTDQELLRGILGGFKDLWCDWTHGGGHVLRDSSGRINWQCAKCGRWATPVPHEDERRMTAAAIGEKME